MNAQQEDLDYQMGVATEQQNAFTMSCLTRKPDDSARINALTAAGRFCVVAIGPEYCQHTDAILGSRKLLLGDCATRAEADAMALAEGEPSTDIDVVVMPYPPLPEVLPSVEGEIPF